MSDIFYILNIPEKFYYHVIIVKLSIVTLVTSDGRIGDFLLLIDLYGND